MKADEVKIPVGIQVLREDPLHAFEKRLLFCIEPAVGLNRHRLRELFEELLLLPRELLRHGSAGVGGVRPRWRVADGH